jgi:hypothetical protein
MQSNKKLKWIFVISWLQFEGKILFRATVVQDFSTFWKDVESEIVHISNPTFVDDSHRSNFESHSSNIDSHPSNIDSHSSNIDSHSSNIDSHSFNIDSHSFNIDSHSSNIDSHSPKIDFNSFEEQPRQQRHSQDFVATSKINVESSTTNVDKNSTIEIRKQHNDYKDFNSCLPSCQLSLVLFIWCFLHTFTLM